MAELQFCHAIIIFFSSRHRGSGSIELDFAAAGMAFFQRRCVKGGPWSESSTQLYCQGGSAANSRTVQERHSSVVGGTTIDQLWLWECFNFTYVEFSEQEP
jgi:hypothetical protein